MRIYLRNDNATKVLPREGNFRKRGVIMQVLGAGTVWFGPDRAPLENTDSNGVPTAGNSITSANGPLVFEQWNGELWLRGSVNGVAVEVSETEVR